MILADKIINERKKNGWSQEELAEKLDVSRQAVSKWESAQATPDLTRIIKMAELFGVTTDYLLKDEYEEPKTKELKEDVTPRTNTVIKVGMEDASAYIENRKTIAPKYALCIMGFILSPVPLITMMGFFEGGMTKLSEDSLGIFGLAILLIMVAACVFGVIRISSGTEKYKYLENEDIETSYGVSGMVKEKKAAFEKKYTNTIAISVVLFILCALPLIISAGLEAKGHILIFMTSLLLVVVAIGVFHIVNVSIIYNSFNVLLCEGEYSKEEKEERKRTANASGIYWCFVTAVYLAWSFITNQWNYTWIVWPVAGVMFGAYKGIIGSILKKRG